MPIQSASPWAIRKPDHRRRCALSAGVGSRDPAGAAENDHPEEKTAEGDPYLMVGKSADLDAVKGAVERENARMRDALPETQAAMGEPGR